MKFRLNSRNILVEVAITTALKYNNLKFKVKLMQICEVQGHSVDHHFE